MGGKKSGGGHTPYEAPDSLRSAQRLRAIGLISLGPIKGSVNKWKSTYFDNTPIQNENGIDDNDTASFNFKNTEVQFNLGTQDQLPLQGFEASEREVSVGAEVKQYHAITRSVIEPDVTRIRLTLGVNALFEQNDKGDTLESAVEFEVLINSITRATYTIRGKSSSRFFRSYMLDNLPPRPFTIMVRRLTADSKSQRVQNATSWVSYTEIIDTKLSYPNMAMVGIKTDSRYNPNFPNINFLLYGRIIKVPSNYDPETRTYAGGLWKGDFKLAWTNNPAWVFYDLVTDKLAGLGQRLGDYGLDKFQLYQIAQYCDELVDDGYGGKEPRMTANLWITEQREAYNVIADMASVFRAIAVWDGTQFTAIQDRPTDPVCSYSQANVVNGKFTRQYVAAKSIFTAVEVEYADERNMYQKAIEYVADDSMIARYGYNVKKITAFGCTSRGQAHRYGKWVLETSRLEQCTITFSVGRQGLMHLPGDIIEVADNAYAGKAIGGKVLAVEGVRVTLDRPIETVSPENFLSYFNAQMQPVKLRIMGGDPINPSVILLEREPEGLSPMMDFVVKTTALSTQLYRAVGISENEDGSYTITALQHEPQKQAIVDGSASFMPVSTTAYKGGLAPVQHAEVATGHDGIRLTFTPGAFVGQGLKYQVKLYREGKLQGIYDDLTEPNLAFSDLPDGAYTAEIRAKNSAGQLSEPTTTAFNVSLSLTELIAVPKIFAIDLQWKTPLFAKANAAIELWVSRDNQFAHAQKLVTLAYPTNRYTYSGLSVGDRYWFWARMIDGQNAGQFTDAVEGSPSREAAPIMNYLHGQITRTELGKSLIDSLKNDVDTAVESAVAKEVTERKAAVGNVLSQINAQAQRNGTAINELRNVDAQQAKQIATITAKAENALAGIATEQKARAAGDKANADKITAVIARVGSAESTLTHLQSTKASKTEVAGIAQSALQATWRADAKSAVDSMAIGGRNLALGTASKSLAQNGDVFFDISKNVDMTTLTAFTISCEVEIVNGKTTSSTQYGRLGCEGQIIFEDGSTLWAGNWRGLGTDLSANPDNFRGKITKTYLLSKRVKEIKTFYINIRNASGKTLRVWNAKFELGNIATDWSPAPEDAANAVGEVSAKIDSVQSTLANADKALSQRIDNITSSLGDARAQISAVNQAVTNANSALGQRIDRVTASVNDTRSAVDNAKKETKAQISAVSRAVAETNGKLSATHTIKAQAIAGGRTAIAGIALGAASDGRTAESSVIVMADKFGVVKNAADSNVVPMLSVVNNKVAISGDLIADGSILGKHIKASQTLSAPIINGGTITGNTINGAAINGGLITGGEISGTVINGATINGGNGHFNGTIYANKIEGDLVKSFICPLDQTIRIPPALISRQLIVMPFEVWCRKATYFENRGKESVEYYNVNIKAELKCNESIMERYCQISGEYLGENAPQETSIMVTVNYYLPAGKHADIKYSVFDAYKPNVYNRDRSPIRIFNKDEMKHKSTSFGFYMNPDYVIILALPC